MALVQCLGGSVMWRPHPNARKWQTWALGDPERSVYRARIIGDILDGHYAPAPDTPLWAVMVAWMLHDGPRLDPGSFPSYASDIRKINDLVGTAPLRACVDTDVYQRLFDQLDATAASESARRAIARTVGAVATWAQGSAWWPYPTEMFGHHDRRRKIRKSAFDKGRDADTAADRTPTQITHDLCPTFDETVAFCTTLREMAADRWGPGARYLGDLPEVQYLTGGRFAEMLVTAPGDLHLDPTSPRCRIDSQLNKAIPYVDGGGTRKATKNGKPRDVAIWAWATDELERIVADATQSRRHHLFGAPNGNIRYFARQYQDLYKQAAEAASYEYTSHWHRHAYASYNLATPAEGGYGRSLKAVSLWLGHSKTDLTAARYWHQVQPEQGWSDHRPGVRR